MKNLHTEKLERKDRTIERQAKTILKLQNDRTELVNKIIETRYELVSIYRLIQRRIDSEPELINGSKISLESILDADLKSMIKTLTITK
tara:strand:+ start:39 stop:305 length:267 start_codon:yes stop_codon:yes gene_type:complete